VGGQNNTQTCGKQAESVSIAVSIPRSPVVPFQGSQSGRGSRGSRYSAIAERRSSISARTASATCSSLSFLRGRSALLPIAGPLDASALAASALPIAVSADRNAATAAFTCLDRLGQGRPAAVPVVTWPPTYGLFYAWPMPVLTTPPDPNQLVRVRDRLWVVADVQRAGQHLVTLTSVEDDGLSEELRVVWELEASPEVIADAELPTPEHGRFDDPSRLDAFLDAVRWGAHVGGRGRSRRRSAPASASRTTSWTRW